MRIHSSLLFLAVTCGVHAAAVPKAEATNTAPSNHSSDSISSSDTHSFCIKDIKTVFGFGDSYTNLMGPEGDVWTWNHFQSNDSVLNAPIRLNGTTAHGPNWIEYLTECYQGLPQNCETQLFDVAYGGATVDSNLVSPAYSHIVDFIHQVKQWKKYIQPAVSWKPDSTLTAIWFGINDVLASSSKSRTELGVLFNKIMDVYSEQLETLYSYGMRSFIVVNVPPMERAPGWTDNQMVADDVKSFNNLLLARVAMFNTKHKNDGFVHYFDAHQYFNEYLDNASKLGFKDTTGSCDKDVCEYPNYQYFWMNANHPMYPVHKLLEKDLTKELQGLSQCSP